MIRVGEWFEVFGLRFVFSGFGASRSKGLLQVSKALFRAVHIRIEF